MKQEKTKLGWWNVCAVLLLILLLGMAIWGGIKSGKAKTGLVVDQLVHIRTQLNRFEARLDCLESGGHKWEYKWKASFLPQPFYDVYLFRCDKCGKTQLKDKFNFIVAER